MGRATLPCLEQIAAQLARDEPALTSSFDFGSYVAQGTGKAPTLLVGDQSEISLHSALAINSLEHRMAHLAHPGDMVLVRRRDPSFESYLASVLRVENLTFLQATPPGDMSLTKHAWRCCALVDRLSKAARQSGGLTIKSYLTTGNTWMLAKAIGEAANRQVHVCGPSPRIARRANDKLWFSRLARSVIGNDATPPTLSAYGPSATAGLVARMSKTADQLVVKVPDSAGSAGNIKLHSAALRGKTIAELRRFLLDRLYSTGWQGGYPVLVGVWDKNVRCSPSVQLWVPLVGKGKPISLGVFEQKVMNEEAAFVGAARSTLSTKVQNRLVLEATQIATVLQQLGYYGICSFDAVIFSEPGNSDVIHWIECNGRWGGVSIPFALVKSLPGGRADGLLIVQETLQGIYLTTGQVLSRFADLLYQPGIREKGILLLSPARSDVGTSVNFLVLAITQEEAEAIVTVAMSRLRSPA